MRIFVLQGPLSWSALQGLDDFPRSCQRLYGGGVDLEAKLSEWERFHDLARPHGAHNGKTPYEALREKP